jgi:hypothetical protein
MRRDADAGDKAATSGGIPTAAIVALVALVVSLALHLSFMIGFDSPVDYYVYYLAGQRLAEGHSPYTVTDAEWDDLARRLGITHYTSPYRYPPYTAVLARIMGPLGARPSAAVWEVANALGFVAGAGLVGLGIGGRRRLALAWAVMLVWGPAYHTLLDGQVGGIVFFLLALASWAMLTRRDVVAGAATALAASLKLTPVALIVYFAWRRRWRTMLAAVAALVIVSVVVLPLASPGDFADYARRAVSLTDPARVNISPQNQTFTAVAGRLLLERTMWGTTGTARMIHQLAIGFAAVLATATAVALWPRRRREDLPRDADALGFGMVIAATLVAGTFTYFHQFSWLFIPLMLIVERLIAARRRGLLVALAVLLVVVDLNEVAYQLFNDQIEGTVFYRLLDAPFLFALTLWGACGWLVWRAERGLPARLTGHERPAHRAPGRANL